jgi:hypothetical protein
VCVGVGDGSEECRRGLLELHERRTHVRRVEARALETARSQPSDKRLVTGASFIEIERSSHRDLTEIERSSHRDHTEIERRRRLRSGDASNCERRPLNCERRPLSRRRQRLGCRRCCDRLDRLCCRLFLCI